MVNQSRWLLIIHECRSYSYTMLFRLRRSHSTHSILFRRRNKLRNPSFLRLISEQIRIMNCIWVITRWRVFGSQPFSGLMIAREHRNSLRFGLVPIFNTAKRLLNIENRRSAQMRILILVILILYRISFKALMSSVRWRSFSWNCLISLEAVRLIEIVNIYLHFRIGLLLRNIFVDCSQNEVATLSLAHFWVFRALDLLAELTFERLDSFL